MTGAKFDGAGFVLINPSSSLLLALINNNGLYDFPKGARDKKETPLETAKRECFEECSILIEEDEMMECGPFFDGQLFLFCAETAKYPVILRNEKSGIIEHSGFDWVKPDKFLTNCVPHLRPIAKKIFLELSKRAHPLTVDYI